MDEAFNYGRLIASRKRAEYKMHLAIVQNPHNEKPQELWDILTSPSIDVPQQRYESVINDEVLDKDAFGRLAHAMSSNPRIQVKC